MSSRVNTTIGTCPFSHQSARQFDMFGEAYQTHPAESLKTFRDEQPVFYSEKMGYWIVTRYEDIKHIFRDPITFSPCNVLEKLTPATDEAKAILAQYNYGMNRTLVNEDEPIHTERRRALVDAFTAENLESHRLRVKKMVEEHVDVFLHLGKVDLVKSLLWEIPLLVALHFLGIPEEDVEELKKFAVAHTVNTWGRPSDEEQIHVATGVGKFWEYSGHVLEKMKRNPDGQGWMYDMIRENSINPTVVTDNYLHSMMMAIMVAAHETTSLASANAVKELLSRPYYWKKLHDCPELIPSAVEECLRYAGSVVAWRRQSTVDTSINGIHIPKGSKIFLVTSAANRDERHFENPDELDIYRDNAIEHLTFGYGAHQCMGKNIGRMEMCIIVETLTRKLPNLRLSEQKFTYLANTSFRGPKHLWVEWDVESINQLDGRIDFPIGNPDTKNLTRLVKVKAIQHLANDVIGIELQPTNNQEPLPNWSAGSHIEFVLPNSLNRKYSLCGESNNGSYYVAVKKEENSRGGSSWIHEHLIEGQELRIKGPKNFFKLNLDAPFHILIAGGIGITPILAMANQLRALNRPYHLIYCGRAPGSMAFLNEVKSHGSKASVYMGSDGRRLDLPLLIKSAVNNTQVCACGPAALLSELEELSRYQQDIQLTIEHFSSSNNLLNPENENAFIVELVDRGIELTVPKDQTLLEVLKNNSIDIASDCCEGLCGSCEVYVESGEIDHRDKVLSINEKQDGKLMMSCCSRGKGILRLKL